MKKSFKKKWINHKIVFPIIMLIFVIFLTVGFSAYQNGLEINDTRLIVRAQTDIRIAGVSTSNQTSGAISNWEEYYSKSINSGLFLPNSDSSITYNVVVTNIGNIDMGLINISGLPNNLTYSISGYTLGNALCDDSNSSKCNLGSVTTLHITVSYKENGYDSNNTTYPIEMIFTFAPMDYVAKIGTHYYPTILKAIEAVPTNGVETTIQILKNTSEKIWVDAGKNIVFDLQSFTLSNYSTYPVIETEGSVKITNGTIYSDTTQGAINVHYGGSLLMTGGSVLANGSKQALYNNGGSVTISGNAYLYNTTNQRAAVHNHDSRGSITITGGTIISEKNSGVLNEAGSLTIGTKDGVVSKESPVIRGYIYGVNNSTATTNVPPTPSYFKYYDGIIKGRTDVLFDEDYIQDTETGMRVLYGNETIGNYSYKTGVLDDIVIIRLDPNGGTVSETKKTIKRNTAIGVLPVPTLTDYTFDGWFDDPDNGNMISTNTTFSGDTTIYAHWTHSSESYVAQIGQTKYHTLEDAITAVPTNSQNPTTIQLISNTVENVSVPSNKKVTFDLGQYTLTSSDNRAVITNAGQSSFISGTITTNSQNTAAINNTGTLTVSGGSIYATGLRQAIYNDGGTLTIQGNPYLHATTSIRATVQNALSNGSSPGTVNILGGTIISPNYAAVQNSVGTLNVGVNSSTLNQTDPVLRGFTYAVMNSATFNFYNGKLMGKSGIKSGNINYSQYGSPVTTTEVVDDITYHVCYLN